MEVELTAAEQRRRQDRASRFAEVDVNDIHFHAKPRRAKSATSRLVGTCTALEKPYLRLTSAPPPETVRPPRVLRRAFELAKTKWGGGGSSGGDGGDGEGRATTVTYAQSCEQFKSLRQDLVVQGVQGTLLAAAYATHARAALQSDDMGEFNQCLTGLRSLHESGVHAAQYELPAASQRRWKSRDGTRGGGGDGGKVGNDDEAEGAGRGTGRNKKRGRKRGRDGGGGNAVGGGGEGCYKGVTAGEHHSSSDMPYYSSSSKDASLDVVVGRQPQRSSNGEGRLLGRGRENETATADCIDDRIVVHGMWPDFEAGSESLPTTTTSGNTGKERRAAVWY